MELQPEGTCNPLLGANLGDVDVEIANWIPFEGLLRGLLASHLRQPADAVAFEAPMQRRSSEMRNCCLQGVKAVIQWQKRVLVEGDNDLFFL
jgi:hypothetical protein